MRRSLPGINYELAAAVRAVNALYSQIPEAHRPDVMGERWQDLEREIDARCGAGDRPGAIRAISVWREHAEFVCSSALANAPLEDRSAA